ncbi:MAG: hypothetical protein PF795_14270 [Kiritimatiellae bacterium]|jgi:hypothetical protein|nr:hypothetical protein [Kiritimatiellia bacterium]
MNDTMEALRKHLASLHGEPLHLVTVSGETLPLFLRARYTLCKGKLFGKDWILAMELEGMDPCTPDEYQGHQRQLGQGGPETVVLVLRHLSAGARNRLVRLGVPFIVPGSQIYLPLAQISLKERFGPPPVPVNKKLTPLAQSLLLRHILHDDIEDLSTKALAARFACSSAAITQARGELRAQALCDILQKGREVSLIFPFTSTRVLWDQAQPLLSSPSRKCTGIKILKPHADLRLAGISALSELTMLSPDPWTTHALYEKELTPLFKTGVLQGCAEITDTDTRLEHWRYNPLLLSAENVVDPLSLYLTLREDPDERVQGELERMVENLPWR